MPNLNRYIQCCSVGTEETEERGFASSEHGHTPEKEKTRADAGCPPASKPFVDTFQPQIQNKRTENWDPAIPW